ncbi:DUF6063 family protein [Tepidibacter aestuarii]|uniref:DUF6063 family protein n=1 Tax=Tepidibacter aestuarii TaxID=2925782 RepID=UPI0020C06AA1|nr:DUF6063 family protein [Tepidibacter aestuarii]CAH2213887.1 conserved protein of unknown function [Tepidibacter aestuarii]
MIDKIDIVGKGLKVLIENGKLDRKEEPRLYEEIINNIDILNDLEKLCQNIGLYLSQKYGGFYVSPIPGVRTFSYSNDELKKALWNGFNNEDMYTGLFIIATIVTEFFPEANEVAAIPFLKVNKLIEIIDNKIDVLRNKANLEEVSYEQSYNFEVVVKKWTELPRIRMNKTDIDNRLEHGKRSKIQVVNTTLRFLENQNLIKSVDFNSDKNIYVTDRFKATIHNVFNNEYIQNEIYDYIEGLREKGNLIQLNESR